MQMASIAKTAMLSIIDDFGLNQTPSSPQPPFSYTLTFAVFSPPSTASKRNSLYDFCHFFQV